MSTHCADLGTDGADSERLVEELIDGAGTRRRLTIRQYAEGISEVLASDIERRATEAAVASLQPCQRWVRHCSVWKPQRRAGACCGYGVACAAGGCRGAGACASLRRLIEGLRGAAASTRHRSASTPHLVAGRGGGPRKLPTISGFTHTVYTATLALNRGTEIKDFRSNFNRKIMNDPTQQNDKPALPYALCVKAFQRLAATYRAQQSLKDRE